MNYKVIIKIVGRVVGIEAALLLIPTVVALIYHESIKGFLISIAIGVIFAVLTHVITIRSKSKFYSKEGFVSVALAWVVMSLIGALPFVIEGEIPSYVDAVFETVSGFTTTGSSILTDIESMSNGLLFWRSLTHFVGGMGILVFMMAVVPMSKDYSMYIMQAEVPGPEASKLTAKVQHSSLILYLIYIALALTEVVALLFCKMPLYDAFIHAMGTAGTGGFSNMGSSVGAYDSASVDIVISVFMVLFGVNFNLYFYLLLRKVRTVYKNEELRFYIGITLFAVVTIALNIRNLYNGNIFTALRYSFFQVSSYISTTGFATANTDIWPMYSKTILVLVMFVGACAGSTAGGLKVSRVLIVLKAAAAEVKHMLHPRSYNPITIEGKEVRKETLRSTLVHFSLYMMTLMFGSIIVAFDNFDPTTTFSSVLTCISNVGPGFGLCGSTGNFSMFSNLSKVVLTVCMLMGRLELFPMLVLFNPRTWKKRGQF